jgi:hypothetical protein
MDLAIKGAEQEEAIDEAIDARSNLLDYLNAGLMSRVSVCVSVGLRWTGVCVCPCVGPHPPLPCISWSSCALKLTHCGVAVSLCMSLPLADP